MLGVMLCDGLFDGVNSGGGCGKGIDSEKDGEDNVGLGW